MFPMIGSGEKKKSLGIRVLGPPEIVLGRDVLSKSVFDKPYALLLYLAVDRRRHRRADLIHLFWPGMSEQSGRHNLNSTIYILKKRLGIPEVFENDRIAVWWSFSPTGADPVDLVRFQDERPADGCEILHEPSFCDRCREKIRLQVEEYRGPFLEDATIPCSPVFERWVEDIRERMNVRVKHLERLLSGKRPVVARKEIPDISWEYRQLTILHVHVQVGAASEGEPDRLLKWLREFKDISEAVVLDRGGWIAPFHGAGVLAYFGFPEAQENASRLAICAAREILDRTSLPENDPPRVKIGIHTGEVVCDLLMGYPDALGTETGKTFSIAAAAPPGEILVSDVTLGSVRSFYWSESCGMIPSRNAQDRQEMHRILGECEDLSVGEFFVGREKNLKDLLLLWKDVTRGHKKVVWITGESGIGKSRLVRALVRSLGQSGTIRKLCCFPEYEKTPWFPLIRFYREFLGLNGRKTPEERQYLVEKYLLSLDRPVEEDLPSFLQFLLGEGPWSKNLPDLPPQKNNLQIEDLIVDMLSGRIRKSPLLLVIEDLSWADHATLALVQKMLRRLDSGPVMFLFTSRTEDRLSMISSVRPDCHMNLLPLNGDESRMLVEGLSRGSFSPDQIQDVMDLGDGVPLFLEEVVRMKRLAPGHRKPDFPPNIRELLSARIDNLGKDREIAQVAACLGMNFPLDLLEAVYLSGVLEGEPLRGLGMKEEILCEKGIWIRIADDSVKTYAFRHALLRDAILRSLPHSTRKEIHRRTVEVLRARFSERIEQEPEFLAEHLTLAGMMDEALPVWVHAAERAVSTGALRDASSHLEKALEIVKMDSSGSEASAARELDLLIAIGPVCRAVHGYGAAQIDAIYGRASELCDRIKGSSRTFPVVYAMWSTALTRRGPGEASGWAEELVRESRKIGRGEESVRASHALGSTLFWGNHLLASERSLKDALSDAAAFYDFDRKGTLSPYAEEPIVGLMCDLSRNFWFQGRSKEAVIWIDRAIERSTGLDHPLSLCLSLSSLILIHFFSGEADKINPVARKMLVLSENNGFRLWVHSALFSLGWAKGDPEGCVMIRDAKRVIMEDLPGFSPLYSALEANAALRAQRPHNALEAIEEGWSGAERTGIRVLDSEFLRLEGEARLMIGPNSREPAERLFREALEKAISSGAFGLALKASLSLARLSPDDARRVRVILERIPESRGTPDWDEAFRVCQDVPMPGLP